MPRFACIGDVHGRYDRVASIVTALKYTDVDAVLMTGDFEYRGADTVSPEASVDLIDDTLRWVYELGIPTLFVPGNHDQRESPLHGNVDRTVQEVAGVRIAGIGGAGPTPMGFPYEWSEEEIRNVSLPRWDVLISHAPPAQTTLDLLHDGERHVGSEAIREIAEHSAGLMICGHVHESAGAERVGRCVVYNVGALGAPFGHLQYGLVTLDRETGTTSIRHVDIDSEEEWTVEFEPVD